MQIIKYNLKLSMVYTSYEKIPQWVGVWCCVLGEATQMKTMNKCTLAISRGQGKSGMYLDA